MSNSVFILFMSFLLFSMWAAIIYVNKSNELLFVMKMTCFLIEIGTKVFDIV
jgi:hypothetical protein